MVDKYNVTTTQNLENLPSFVSMEQELYNFKNNDNRHHADYSFIVK
jgi:hypothetical protein